MRVTFTHEIEEYDFDGQVFNVLLTVEAELSPFDPGCTYGPPENCYPPEGGDVEELTVTVTLATTAGDAEAQPGLLTLLEAAIRAKVAEGGELAETLDERAREEAADIDTYDPPEPDWEERFPRYLGDPTNET